MNATTNKPRKPSLRDQERDSAIRQLRDMIKPGDTVLTIPRHCSRSGMRRSISAIINGDDYSWLVVRAIGGRIDQKHGGIVMDGCGMDMGFELVYLLGRTLFPDGFKVPKGRCGRNGDTSGHDSDGGYAFNHRWL